MNQAQSAKTLGVSQSPSITSTHALMYPRIILGFMWAKSFEGEMRGRPPSRDVCTNIIVPEKLPMQYCRTRVL